MYLRISRIARRSPAALMRSTERMNRARVRDGFVIVRYPAHFNHVAKYDAKYGESIQRTMSKNFKATDI